MKSIVVLLALFCLCQGQRKGQGKGKGQGGVCPKGWIKFHDDRCYYISSKADTFDGANKYCKSRNSHLAPVLTCDAHIFLVNFLADLRAKCPRGQRCDEYWIGIQNVTETNWITGNGLLVERKQRCQQWGKGYPRGNGTCGIMSIRGALRRGVWKNVNCTNIYKYVCITCPNNFDYVPELNECFYLNVNLANWSNAQKNCAKMKDGARLMSIHDSAKQKAVVNYMKMQIARKGKASEICILNWFPQAGRLLWMGGQTRVPDVCNVPYVWKQLGAADIPFTYTNWLPGMPNCLNGEHCLILTTSETYDYRWEDFACSYEICSLCEF